MNTIYLVILPRQNVSHPDQVIFRSIWLGFLGQNFFTKVVSLYIQFHVQLALYQLNLYNFIYGCPNLLDSQPVLLVTKGSMPKFNSNILTHFNSPSHTFKWLLIDHYKVNIPLHEQTLMLFKCPSFQVHSCTILAFHLHKHVQSLI